MKGVLLLAEPSTTASGLLPTNDQDLLPYVVNVARRQPCDLYIGRAGRGRDASIWANPHKLASNSLRARLRVIVDYFDDLHRDDDRITRLPSLAGQVLGCWCAPKLCHGHLLAMVARYGADNVTVGDWVSSLAETASALPPRVLVTGSRSWTDREVMRNELNQVWVSLGRRKDTTLVVGDAAGADHLAAELWRGAGFPVEQHTADWDNLGKRAGMVRNAAMVATGVDRCLAFANGETPGTRQCATLAEKAGIPVRVISPT